MTVKTVDFSVWPKGEPNTAYAQYLTQRGRFPLRRFLYLCTSVKVYEKNLSVCIQVHGRAGICGGSAGLHISRCAFKDTPQGYQLSAAASNVITYLAKGDLALSVGMTGVSTILAPLLTPVLTWALAGHSVHVNVFGMLLSILWVVILPIVIGLIIKSLWPKFTDKAVDYLPAFSSVAIAFIVAIIIAANADKLLAGGMIIVLVVMLHNICGLGLGYFIGRLLRLSEPKKRAISIEVGMQNSGLASSLATLHFAAYPLATIPGAIFSVLHNISGAIVAYIFRK